MHCGDSSPHGSHTWYGPDPAPGAAKQIAHQCPGTAAAQK